MIASRPLRFLAVLLFGWILGRSIAIYENHVGIADRQRPQAHAQERAQAQEQRTPAMSRGAWIVRAAARGPSPTPGSANAVLPGTPTVRFTTSAPPTAALIVAAAAQSIPQPRAIAGVAPTSRLAPIAPTGSRWAASAWLIARGGMAPSVATSQLGASQAGFRLTHALGRTRRVALAARVSAPLSGPGREAAVGLDWQPTAAPIHVLAEQRVSLDGGKGGPTLGLIGGFGPTQVAPGVRLEGYGQAGVIARNGGEAFADGALRATHPLTALGGLHIDVGAGAWGGAQRGASRLDVGPSLGLIATVDGRTIRLSADWRQRVAGSARPGSGPALSIGTNF